MSAPYSWSLPGVPPPYPRRVRGHRYLLIRGRCRCGWTQKCVMGRWWSFANHPLHLADVDPLREVS